MCKLLYMLLLLLPCIVKGGNCFKRRPFPFPSLSCPPFPFPIALPVPFPISNTCRSLLLPEEVPFRHVSFRHRSAVPPSRSLFRHHVPSRLFLLLLPSLLLRSNVPSFMPALLPFPSALIASMLPFFLTPFLTTFSSLQPIPL
jgi:hypothetical protein